MLLGKLPVSACISRESLDISRESLDSQGFIRTHKIYFLENKVSSNPKINT